MGSHIPKYTKESIINIVDAFIKTYDYLPSTTDLSKNKLVGSVTIYRYVSSMDEIFSALNINKFDFYKEKFINLCKQNDNKAIGVVECSWSKNKIPTAKWLIENCPDDSVIDYNSFISYCGFKPNYNISKEYATSAILKKRESLERNLIIKDFYNLQKDEIGIGTITNIWGTFNNMMIDLGFSINQEGMSIIGKNITFEEICLEIKEKCKLVNIDNIINTSELINILTYSLSTYRRYLTINLDTTFSDYIQSLGYQTIKEGSGFVHSFNDGEKTLSQYEFNFSSFLRNDLQLKYNEDYKKDVKYKTFIPNHKFQHTIDYIINYKNRVIYIEVAGLLRDYKQWYLNNRILTSNSKEKYRLSLKEKEKMLKDNNLEYYILFPEDLTQDFLLSIFN